MQGQRGGVCLSIEENDGAWMYATPVEHAKKDASADLAAEFVLVTQLVAADHSVTRCAKTIARVAATAAANIVSTLSPRPSYA